jgi:hypothetical protein
VGLFDEEIRSVGPYVMSDMILTSLLTKTQMRVKMTMILSAGHGIKFGPLRDRRNVNFHGMGN